MNTSQAESCSVTLSGLLRAAAVQETSVDSTQSDPTPAAAPQGCAVKAEDLLIFRVREARRRIR